MDLEKMEKNYYKIILLMEQAEMRKLSIARKYLPEIIDSIFVIINDSIDGLPLIERSFEEYLNQEGIKIEYSEIFIHIIKNYKNPFLEKAKNLREMVKKAIERVKYSKNNEV